VGKTSCIAAVCCGVLLDTSKNKYIISVKSDKEEKLRLLGFKKEGTYFIKVIN
jgi:hypothetical protein